MGQEFMWGDSSYVDIKNGIQPSFKHVRYVLGDMSGAMDVGNVRKRQEDALLLLENKGAKLMLIADGMGGLANGDLASNYCAHVIGEWFLKYDINENSDVDIIKNQLKELLYAVSWNICREYNGGTTLSLVIKLKEITFTVNIGDSRIYICDQNGKIEQISNDQSEAWEQYKKGIIKYKEDIRYYRRNNLIYGFLGDLNLSCIRDFFVSDSLIISNNDYDSLLLFSDGITDFLSDSDIERIIACKKHDKLDERLIASTLKKREFNNNLNPMFFDNQIIGGKDNLSTIVYKKVKK